MPPAYLVLVAGPSAPWTLVRRSEPDRRPGPEGSSGSGLEAPLAADRALQTGWEQMLEFRYNTVILDQSTCGVPYCDAHDWL